MQLCLRTLLVLALAACSSKEASQMEELADKLCKCEDLECAQPIYDAALTASKENKNKKTSASAAEKYKHAGERLSKCMQTLVNKGPAKKTDKPADKPPEKKDEKK